MKKNLYKSVVVFLFSIFYGQAMYAANGDTLKVRVHDKADMTWYGYYNKWGVFPDTSNSYRKIIMHYTMGCATGGCSPWDYTTKIEALHNTGKLDSTLVKNPKFNVDGNIIDTLLFTINPSYVTYYDSILMATDSVLGSYNSVVFFNDSLNPTIATDTLQAWEVEYWNYYFNNAGDIVDSVWVNGDSTLVLSYWEHYDVFNVMESYELARVITPYGGNLPSNYSFTQSFDVTDFEKLLRDSVEIRAKYEGWSSGFSVTLDFEFIIGTPIRAVKKIENIYQGDFSYTNSSAFESNYLYSKKFLIDTSTKQAKVRMTATGHGFDNNINAAEFKPISYYLKVNGQQTHSQLNWRSDCGENPIYPDYETGTSYSHTWLYDRANWCPGLKAHTFEHNITPKISSGDSIDINVDFQSYTWSGTQTPSYIVESQLVQYGEPNFNNDVELLDIISPSSKDEHARKNPICRQAQIAIRNSGKNVLTNVAIEYNVVGGTKETYNWTGSLNFLDTTIITLPINASNFWISSSSENIFEVTLSNPNGTSDEYTNDNFMQSSFEIVPVYPSNFFVWLKTNTKGYETAYKIFNESGIVVAERSNMENSKEYKDTLNLPSGCYVFEITDSGKDGLAFPYNNAGSGYLRFKEVGGSTFKTFKANFGTNYIQHFSVVNSNEIATLIKNQNIEIYPNPNNGNFYIEINSAETHDVEIEIWNVTGQKIKAFKHDAITGSPAVVDLKGHAKGLYLVKVISKNQEPFMKKVVLH